MMRTIKVIKNINETCHKQKRLFIRLLSELPSPFAYMIITAIHHIQIIDELTLLSDLRAREY